MNPNILELAQRQQTLLNRRHFFSRSAAGIGTAALASLLNPSLFAAPGDAGASKAAAKTPAVPGILSQPHYPAKAKRVIYLFMSGGPSHIDLFDYKAKLKELHGTELPAEVRMGQRVTGMTSGQKSFPCVSPMFQFQQHGQSGQWVSE